MKRVDIIIPTYKPDAKVEKLLNQLKIQTYPINRILILNTEEKLWNQYVYGRHNSILRTQFVNVFHHSKKEFDHGKTRDRGMKRSDADIVICMTQDAIPNDEYLIENLVKAFNDPLVAVSYARQLPTQDSSEVEKVAREFNYPNEDCMKSRLDLERLGIKTYFCSNVCAAYRRDIYVKLGGFISRAIFNEDMIYAAKAIENGYKIAYVANATVIHSHNYTNKQQFSRNFDIGVSQAQHPEVFANITSESEGMKLVKVTREHLKKIGRKKDIFPMYVTCAYKLIGFKMGKNYQKLPRKLVRKWSLNPEFWK